MLKKLESNKLRSNQSNIHVEDIQGYQMIYNNLCGIREKNLKN